MLNPHGVVDAVIVQSPTEAGIADNEERVREVMRARHQLHPEQPDDFTLETSDSALAFWNKIQGYLVLAGVALPAIGLVVGAIVIMNIMLVAVAERTREIGIRKALGARRRDILRQFLVESTTLATLGAAIGVGMGFAFAKLISMFSPLPAAVELWSVVLGRVGGRWRRHHCRRLSGQPRRAARPHRRAAAGVADARDSSTAWIFNLTEGVGIAVESIRGNKVRAGLTILGIAVGVFVVVVISAAVHGINASVAKDLESAGPKTFFVSRYPISVRGLRRHRRHLQVAAQSAAHDGRSDAPWMRCPACGLPVPGSTSGSP